MAIRVLLATGMVMFREPLKAFLEREGCPVVAETSDGRDVMELARQHRPEVVVLDIALAHLNGFQAARQLQRTCPSVRVILLAMPEQEAGAREAFRYGARGLLLQTQPVEDLLFAIREVKRGCIYVGPQISDGLLQAKTLSTRHEGLSRRESEVLRLIAQGQSTKQIAGILGISVKTAGFHRDRLMKRLNIHETAGLVRYAIRHSLIVP